MLKFPNSELGVFIERHNMFASVVKFLYPTIQKEEIRKFSLLSLAFFLTIGAYWMLRLLKDTIFFTMAFPQELGWALNQGKDFQPMAKMCSVIIVFLMVLVYSKLVDRYDKQKLFTILCSFFGLIFAVMTGMLFTLEYFGPQAIGKLPLALFGWISYFSVESFGSLLVSLFWAYSASVNTTEAAKRGYPLIIASAQFGSIGGSFLTLFAKRLGYIWPYFFISTVFVFCIMFVIQRLIATVPNEQLIGSPEAAATEKTKEGFFEGMVKGLVLIFSRPYIFGILIVSTVYEVILTIVDFQMKAQACTLFKGPSFLAFYGWIGVAINSLAFFIALVGLSYLFKRFGLRFCLLFFPVGLGLALFALYFYFVNGNPDTIHLLWATAAVIILGKGLSYAVNNPTKEMMYIPTSKDTKFKAKGFIDSLGGRLAKASGASVNNMFKYNLTVLMSMGTMIGFGLIGIWLVAAVYIGIKNAKLVKTGTIVS
jgi:ATP:ADP antiporter, AAA family